MAKFYVESGPNLKAIVAAHDVFEAIMKTLDLKATEEPLQLADVIVVNERGFVADRTEQRLFGDEIVIPTRLVLGDPAPRNTDEQKSS
ncbi:MAG: hypothetical protein RIC55_02700 [Pirellulaceae bacterium]